MEFYGNDNPNIGLPVEYVDENGRSHTALITALHGTELGVNAINLVYVSSDATQTDPYGRQIARAASVSVEGPYTAHGRFYRVK